MIAAIARPGKTRMSDTTETPAATNRETWENWLPGTTSTLTIEDVLVALRERNVTDVTARTIRTWQRDRILPAPIRGRVGRGPGSNRALYPATAVDVIAQVRHLQHEGVKNRDLASELRKRIVPQTATLRTTTTKTVPQTATLQTTTTRTVPQTAALSIPPKVDDPVLLDAVIAAAGREAQRVGSSIFRVEVVFTDERGKRHGHVFLLD